MICVQLCTLKECTFRFYLDILWTWLLWLSSCLSLLRHYTVRYREKDKKWNYQTCPTSDTVIDNLKPNAVYEFGVKPISKEGRGEWSKPVVHNTSNVKLTGSYSILWHELINYVITVWISHLKNDLNLVIIIIMLEINETYKEEEDKKEEKERQDTRSHIR